MKSGSRPGALASPCEFLAVEDTISREVAHGLISEYLEWIAFCAAVRYGLSFDVEAMVRSDIEDRDKFYPPCGRFYLIRNGNAFVGVGCLRGLSPTVAEIQRMYLQPRARGFGMGRRLLEKLLIDAREIGYEVVRLESLKFLSEAHALYKSSGFVEIGPYTKNGMERYQAAEAMDAYRASAVFMELRL